MLLTITIDLNKNKYFSFFKSPSLKLINQKQELLNEQQ